MPNIRISGTKAEYVKDYADKMEEICQLINAAPENVIFIASNDQIYPDLGKRTPIFITVEWMQRETKEELFAKHLTEYFSQYSEKVLVFFTDINNKWYVNGKKI